MRLSRNLRLLWAAAFLRSIGIGLTGVVLGIYLSRLGFSATSIGLLIAAGLSGGALATLLASLGADQLGRRRTLVGLSLLLALGGVGLAGTTHVPAIFLLAFLGMLNGMGRDRGAAYALDQAMIPEAVPTEHRTGALAWYNLILDAGHALGALAALLPVLFRSWLAVDVVGSYQLAFGIYALLALLSGGCYAALDPTVEIPQRQRSRWTLGPKLSPSSKKIVTQWAALSGLDSLGGGFLTSALIAYWFFRRFGVAEESLGPLFFGVRLANAASYLVAAWLARRIGLLNTMVFTHIPSSLFLLLVAFAPSFPWAVVLFLARECLVEMDVPTRQSYLVAVVGPPERTFASGVTNLTRNAAWAVAPSLAGPLMQQLALAAPLFLGASLKITYDLLLYRVFRGVRPPEEQTTRG